MLTQVLDIKMAFTSNTSSGHSNTRGKEGHRVQGAIGVFRSMIFLDTKKPHVVSFAFC